MTRRRWRELDSTEQPCDAGQSGVSICWVMLRCGCWVTGSNLKLAKDPPLTICLKLQRGAGHLGGLQASLSYSFSLSLSLTLSLYVFLFLLCCSLLPLSYTLLHCFLFSIQHVCPTCTLHHNNPDKSHKQFSTALLHFFFFLPLLHFLSSDFLCFKASYSLFKYAIERHIRSSKTISKLINNCQVRGKAERAWATLKAHQRPEEGEAWRWEMWTDEDMHTHARTHTCTHKWAHIRVNKISEIIAKPVVVQ